MVGGDDRYVQLVVLHLWQTKESPAFEEASANKRNKKLILTTIINIFAQGKLRPVNPTLDMIKTRGSLQPPFLNLAMISVLAEADNLP